MGRDRKSGVTIRKYPSGKEAIQIAFMYRGVECREVLKGLEPTKQNKRYAENLKGEIDLAITRQTFRYADYFPNSKRARLFGHFATTTTIEELLTDWLKDIERTHPHSTYRCYKKSCRTLINGFGEIRASDLTPQHIREWIRSRDVTPKTIRNDLTPLRAVLDQALSDELIDKNPLDKVKVNKLVSRSNKSNYEVDPFTVTEINKVLAAAAEYDPLLKNLLQFAFYTGLRTSELFGLQWGDIDWTAEQFRVSRAVVERKEKETKTKAGTRDVILLPAALEALQRQRPLTQLHSVYVFTRPDDRGPLVDYEHLERPWKIILRNAKVRYRNPYQTRHTYASQLLSGGENPLFVSQQLGHKTIEMVMRHYGRWVEQGKEKQKHVFTADFAKNRTSIARENNKQP